MSDSGGIPEFQCSQPDGRPRTRLEMDEWLRKEVPKVHWLRIHSSRTLGLPKQIAWDMREIVLRHWILDELVRRQLITGDLLGVNPNTSNDEAELRQFTQRLTALLQTGQAVQPQHAEGVDMNGYTPPPPPVMGGAAQQAPQTAYAAGPPAPPGVPAGAYQSAPPGPPQFQPPPGPPPAGPPGYAPPPSGVPMAPSMQPGPVPMGPPPNAPPQAGPPAPPAGGRRGKREGAPQAAPPPAMPVPPMGGPPQGFAPAGYAQPPQGYAPQVPAAPQVASPQQVYQQAPQVAPQIDLTEVHVKLEQVINNLHSMAMRNAALEKRVDLLSMMVTILSRGIYQKPGNSDISAFLIELGVPLPQ